MTDLDAADRDLLTRLHETLVELNATQRYLSERVERIDNRMSELQDIRDRITRVEAGTDSIKVRLDTQEDGRKKMLVAILGAVAAAAIPIAIWLVRESGT